MKSIIFVPIKLNSQRLENKMLLPLGEKVLCQHIFKTLVNVKKHLNVDIYCFCSSEKIKEYLGYGQKFGVDIKYVYEQEPLGTAGSLSLLKIKMKDTI